MGSCDRRLRSEREREDSDQIGSICDESVKHDSRRLEGPGKHLRRRLLLTGVSSLYGLLFIFIIFMEYWRFTFLFLSPVL